MSSAPSPQQGVPGLKGAPVTRHRQRRQAGDQALEPPPVVFSSACDSTARVRGQSSEPPQPVDESVCDRYGAGTGSHPVAGHAAADSAQILYTPAQAAELLQIRESWLRRRAARRSVPCTFLGKHLRFSRQDLEGVVAAAAQPEGATARSRHSSSTSGRVAGRQSARPRLPSKSRRRPPDEHI
ncbi:helix-turn-helix domain-containing protein [Lentzea flava]|uniref:helix-turn-helix domain-containing protein n=1 Tax=Lentzea flava TaxID=103732 RepID=UPI00355911EB